MFDLWAGQAARVHSSVHLNRCLQIRGSDAQPIMHKDQSLLSFPAATLCIISCKTDSEEAPTLVVVQIWSSKGSPGVHRSPLQPEETRGLTRSGDISRMLPFEVHLLAASRAAVSGPTDAAGDFHLANAQTNHPIFPIGYLC